MSKTPEYRTWSGLVQRCTNPKNASWDDYGGRGIKVCDEWRHNFLAFWNYIGPRPSSHHSLDRINNDGNYEPGNVRWAPREVQASNKRTSLSPAEQLAIRQRAAEQQAMATGRCFCGCRGETEPGSLFVRGHDKLAFAAYVALNHDGSTARFLNDYGYGLDNSVIEAAITDTNWERCSVCQHPGNPQTMRYHQKMHARSGRATKEN